MEKNDRNLTRWVEECLAALEPPTGFRPNVANGLARVHERDRAYKVTRRRWFWGFAAAAAVCLAALSMPAPCHAAGSSTCGQPIATRLWDSVFRKPAAPTPAPVGTLSSPTPAPVAPPVAAKPAPPPAPVPPPAAQSMAAASFKLSGSPAASITCEVYSDYECPSCALAFRDVIPLLVSEYVQTGKARLLHRDFPLTQHPYAKLAARYANAAGRSGAYDPVVDQLFRTQPQWAQNGNIAGQLAEVLSPPMLRRVEELVKSPQFDDTIDGDLVMALQDHINRTPSIVVVFRGKRQVFSGIPEYPLLKGYLDELLGK